MLSGLKREPISNEEIKSVLNQTNIMFGWAVLIQTLFKQLQIDHQPELCRYVLKKLQEDPELSQQFILTSLNDSIRITIRIRVFVEVRNDKLKYIPLKGMGGDKGHAK